MRKVKNIVFYLLNHIMERFIRGPAIAYQTYLKHKDTEVFRLISKAILKTWRKLSGASKKAKYFHREVQEKVDHVLQGLNNAELVQCKKGCSACCHTQVAVTVDEAEHLAKKVLSGSVEINRNLLHLQAKLSDDYDQWMRLPYESRRCVFLGAENSCSVYEDRPAVCRTNYALSEPQYCETKDGVTQPQRLLLTVDADLVVALVFEVSAEKGSLPKMLEQSLTRQNILLRS